MRIVCAILLCCSLSESAFAQLADPGKNDHFVSFFGEYTQEAGFAGSVASTGELDMSSFLHVDPKNNLVSFTWQLDYGSLGTKRVTPTNAVPSKEPDISKNSGQYAASFARLFSSQFKLALGGGAEHKRTADGADAKNAVTLLAFISGRHLGAKIIGPPDSGPELAWLVQGTAGTGGLLSSTGAQSTELFLDPLGVLWLSFAPGRYRQQGSPDRLFYRLQFRAEGALMYAATAGYERGQHWDGSLTYYQTPAIGVGVRRFNGFFDHNLRDRVEVQIATVGPRVLDVY